MTAASSETIGAAMSNDCPGCGAPAPPTARRVQSVLLARCAHCGLYFTLPRRTDDELAALYDDAYFDDWLGADPASSDVVRLLADHVPRVRFVGTLRPPGRLLDVGAGTGLFVEAARRMGWRVAGVEPSAAAWRAGQRVFGLADAYARIEDLPVGETFDVICFWHSLEHHADPQAALVAARRLLEPGGFLVIECPNVASLDRYVCGERWSGWHLPWHTVHYSPETLATAVIDAGFSVLDVRRALWRPAAGLLRSVDPRRRRRVREQTVGDRSLSDAMPFILRFPSRTPQGRLARVLTGREMLLFARLREASVK